MCLNRFLASDLRFLQCRCQLGDPADPAMAVTRSARRVGAIGTTLGRPNVPNNAGDFGPSQVGFGFLGFPSFESKRRALAKLIKGGTQLQHRECHGLYNAIQ